KRPDPGGIVILAKRDSWHGETLRSHHRILLRRSAESPRVRRRADWYKALSHPYFAAPEPQELIYEEIEAIRGRIDQADDWSAFEAKLAALETASQAYEPSED
ncbi:MAG: hypothetical protein U1A07_02185, partial [Phenylobacterium sp.]|nr:hypothetical protein [Phenylobacterium sp.]